ncbi:phage tail protein [Ruminococcus albus]|uniref:phage tail protein n=1 Tax=Ruminococcus albus TaxID=1264 RepID=UPI00048B6B94|nr:phage tail protein [Ruminococcus albus]
MYNVYADNTMINDPSASSDNALTGTITKAVNGIDSFSFRIYSNNAGWNKLECLKTHIHVADVITGDSDTFHGRILTISPTMESSGLIYKDVQCEGELSYLQDSTQRYHYQFRTPLSYILDKMLDDHNDQVDDGKKIYLGQVISASNSVTYEWGYGKTWETLHDLLAQDGVGGEIRLRYENGNRYLDYTSETFSGGSDTVIEAGVNLVSLTQTIDPTAMITDLYAYGAKTGNTEQRIALPNVIYDEDRRTLAGGIVAGTVIFDDITDVATLETAAQAYFDAMRPIRKQYKITAADLSLIDQDFEEFKLGYQYKSRNPLIGVDEVVRLIGTQIKIEDRMKNTLTFGDKFDTLTTMTSKKSKEIKMQFEKQPELIQAVVEHQSEIIRGVEGGYRYDVVDNDGKPVETIYMNSPDVDTATQALRLNQNGLGFWKKSTGGGNPLTGNYDYAWTIDGLLNTAYITAQTITGLKFNNGNGTFQVNENGSVTAKAINIRGGSIDVNTASQTTDVIRLNHNEWTMEISPLQVKVTNSTIGGYIIIQAGAITGFWNDQLKFSLNSNTGTLSLFGLNGVMAFQLFSNNNTMVCNDSSGNQTIAFDGNTGHIYCSKVHERNP